MKFNLADSVRAATKAGQQHSKFKDRISTLGASETFDCIRLGWLRRFKPDLADTDDIPYGIFERGNVTEASFFVPKIISVFGRENVLFIGSEQETFKTDKSSATPDSLIINQPRDILAEYGIPDIGEDGTFMIECKSFNPQLNLYKEKTVNRGQAVMQLGEVRRNTQYKPTYNVILYINVADYDDLRDFIVEYDEDIYQAGIKRGELLYSATKATQLKPEGKYTDRCLYCEFSQACKALEVDKVPVQKKLDVPQDVLDRLTTTALRLQALDEELDKLEQEKVKLREEVKDELISIGTNSLVKSGLTVSYVKMKGKKTLDKGKLKADGIELDEYFKEGAEFTRLNISYSDKNKKNKKQVN